MFGILAHARFFQHSATVKSFHLICITNHTVSKIYKNLISTAEQI